MRKNIFKIFATTFTVAISLFALAACKNSSLDYNHGAEKTQDDADKAIVTFRINDKSFGRSTITANDLEKSDVVTVELKIERYNENDSLTLVQMNGGNSITYGPSNDGTMNPIQVFEASQLLLNPGKYKFTLILYATDDKNGVHGERVEYEVQSGELDNVNIHSGANDPLVFNTKYTKQDGDLSVTFEFDFADIVVSSDNADAVKEKIGGYSVKAGLFREMGETGVQNAVTFWDESAGKYISFNFESLEIDEDDIKITKDENNNDVWSASVLYAKNNVPNGTYYICFEVYEGGNIRNTYVDIVKVKSYKTAGECKLANTNTVYNITYDLNGGAWAESYAAPDSHTPNQGIILPANEENTVISRTGYTFLGWLDMDEYDNDSSYNARTSYISAGKENAKDFSFKAQWGFDHTLFVSSSGNDANNGLTLGTAFASVQKAVDYIKDYESSEGDCIEDFSNYVDDKEWKIFVSGHIGTSENPSTTTIGEDITTEVASQIIICGNNENTLENGTYTINSYTDILDACSDTGNKVFNGKVLTINTLVPVSINNIKITGGYETDSNGGGIDVEAGSHNIGEGTFITGNYAVKGGGLYIAPGTEVYMTGGEITGNQDDYASEVFHYGRIFSMSGSAVIRAIISADGGSVGSGAIFLNNDFNDSGAMTGIHRTVTIGGALTRTLSTGEKVAKIKANKYVAGMTILTGSKEYPVTSTVVSKFAMTESGYALEYSNNSGKLMSSSVGGNVTTNDGLLSIGASSMGGELYINKGSIVFTALPKGQSSLPANATITWDAKLLYGGVDVNEYSESGKEFYKFKPSDDTLSPPGPCLSIKNTLDVAGNYQVYVTAVYKPDDDSPAVTSSQTFNFDFTGYYLEANCASADFRNTFKQAILTAKEYSQPIDIMISGTGTAGTNENSNTLTIIKNTICSLQTDVSLDLSMVSGIETIPQGAFVDCDCLKSIKLPYSTNTIKSGAFMRDDSSGSEDYFSPVEYISFYDTVEIIEGNALPFINQIKKFEIIPAGAENPVFSTAENDLILLKRTSEAGASLTQEVICVAADYKADLVTLDFSQEDLSHVTSISPLTFFGSSMLESVNFGNVVTIGETSFYSCPELTTVNFNTIGIVIEEDAFGCCAALTDIDLSKVASVSCKAFEATGITQLSIPAGIDFLNKDENGEITYNNAFYHCSNLTSVTIDARVDTDMTGHLFEICENIESFTIDESKGSYEDGQTRKYYVLENGALLVKYDTDGYTVVAAAAAADIEAINFGSKEDPEGIGVSLSNINRIGPSAFALDPNSEHSNVKLRTITSFGNVTEIEAEAFKNSTLTTIGGFNKNLVIKGYAFAYSNLTTIPKFLEGMTFYDKVFWYTNVTTFEFGSDDIHVYGNPAFATLDTDDENFNDNKIKIILDFDINSNNIGKLQSNYTNQNEFCLFRGLDDGQSIVTELVLNGKVTLPDLSDSDAVPAFDSIRTDLEKITFAGEDSVIGAYQFYASEDSNPWDDIDDSRFANLEDIDLTGVTRIGDNAFQNTKVGGLSTLDLKNVQIIGKEAFKSSSVSTAKIKLPASVRAIGYSAFMVRGYNYNPHFGMSDFDNWSEWTDDNIGEWYKTDSEETWNSWITNNPTSIQSNKITASGDSTVTKQIEEIIAPNLEDGQHEQTYYLYKLQ